MSVLKKESSFTLTSDEETKIVSYITEMQSSDFGLRATDLRRHTFQIAKKSAIRKSLSQ
jgi:peroxiredoxin